MMLYGPLGRLNLFVLHIDLFQSQVVCLLMALSLHYWDKEICTTIFFFLVPDWGSVSGHWSPGLTSIIPVYSSFSFWEGVCLSDHSSPLHPMLQAPSPQGIHREAPSPSAPPCQCCFPAPPGLAEPLPWRPCSDIPSHVSWRLPFW